MAFTELETVGGLVVVMRAGLGFLPAFQERYPAADVGFIDITSPNEEELPAQITAQKIPDSLNGKDVIVLEPVIAYGKAVNLAVEAVSTFGATPHIASLVVSDRAAASLANSGVQTVWTISQDGMDPDGWLRPGVGDVGDRQWGSI